MKFNPEEIDYVFEAVWTKVFQENPDRKGLAAQIAMVAVRAHHEWGDIPIELGEYGSRRP